MTVKTCQLIPNQWNFTSATLNDIRFVFFTAISKITTDFPFKNLRKLSAQHTETMRKNVWEKSYDAYSLSIRVQTTIFRFVFYHNINVNVRARAEKGIARHIEASSVVWLGPGNFWLVLSEHAHASYPGFFFRPPGFSPYMGQEERRVQGLD